MLEIAETHAPIGFLDGQAQQAHLTKFGPEFAGKAVVAIDAIGQRSDPPPGELADRLAQGVSALAQPKIEFDIKHGQRVSLLA
jgi:hypothetical protein